MRLVWLSLLIATPAFGQEYRSPIEPPASGTRPYVTAYRDLSSGSGVQDWNCGNNAYNGHRGTDIGIGGFPVMDAGSRWAVAAADGEVATAVEGCFDRCTSGQCDCGAGFGNYVKITHADGKSTFYGHLMRGSVQVSVGDHVTCGQRLGKVGSSGNSTGPHLHFEPRYSNNVSDDPFSGSCGGPTSFWVAQGNYNELPGTTCAGGMPTPDTATIKGVVWDRSVTNTPSAPGNVRVPGTSITVDGGQTLTSRPVDAYWEFVVQPGTYRIVYHAPGYLDEEQTLTVAARETRWASIGLAPENGMPPARDDAILIRGPMLVEVEPAEMFDAVFTVLNTGTTTWRDSDVTLALDSGYAFGAADLVLDPADVIAPGDEKTWILALTASTAEGAYDSSWRMVRGGSAFGPLLELTAVVITSTVTPDPDPDPEPEPEPNPNPRVTEEPDKPTFATSLETKKIQGGCGCQTATTAPTSPIALWLLLAFGLLVRRVCRPAVARRRTMLD